jgi:hypothetical protein
MLKTNLQAKKIMQWKKKPNKKTKQLNPFGWGFPNCKNYKRICCKKKPTE